MMGDARSQGFVQVSVPEGYERFMLRQLFEPWAAELLSRADLHSGWSVLDVASGPGSVARLAATAVGPGGRVVASDISEPMLALAAATPAAAGAAVIEFLACFGDRCAGRQLRRGAVPAWTAVLPREAGCAA
jgi:ubiquinone/menaquinone biosynthesis C-methylase UbiE